MWPICLAPRESRTRPRGRRLATDRESLMHVIFRVLQPRIARIHRVLSCVRAPRTIPRRTLNGFRYRHAGPLMTILVHGSTQGPHRRAAMHERGEREVDANASRHRPWDAGHALRTKGLWC